MKNNFKKYLIASFGLGISSLTAAAIASSCGIINNSSDNSKDNSDSPSEDSLTTEPGQPLTQTQINYQKKLASQIQVQFDANAKLDYTVPADKANIDNQIKDYQTKISSGALKDFINKFNALDNTDAIKFNNELKILFSDLYDNFKQKNLIPTETTINEYYKKINPEDSTSDWKVDAGKFAVFYSDPKNIILIAQCALMAGKDSLSPETEKLISDVILPSIPNKNMLSASGPDYIAFSYYEDYISKLKN